MVTIDELRNHSIKLRKEKPPADYAADLLAEAAHDIADLRGALLELLDFLGSSNMTHTPAVGAGVFKTKLVEYEVVKYVLDNTDRKC
jgi:hypothetical protein